MASKKKINTLNICLNTNHILETIENNKLCLVDANNSDCKLNLNFLQPLQLLLPYYLAVSMNFYQLTKSDDKLNPLLINDFHLIIGKMLKRFFEDYSSSEHLEQYIMQLVKQIDILEINKKQFEKSDFVQFNSRSLTHNYAFNYLPLAKRKNNIVLKFNGPKPEAKQLRVGIICHSIGKFELIKIVEKRKGNG